MTKATFNQEEKTKICLLIEQGLSVDEIAIDFKMSTKDFMEIAFASLYRK